MLESPAEAEREFIWEYWRFIGNVFFVQHIHPVVSIQLPPVLEYIESCIGVHLLGLKASALRDGECLVEAQVADEVHVDLRRHADGIAFQQVPVDGDVEMTGETETLAVDWHEHQFHTPFSIDSYCVFNVVVIVAHSERGR